MIKKKKSVKIQEIFPIQYEMEYFRNISIVGSTIVLA